MANEHNEILFNTRLINKNVKGTGNTVSERLRIHRTSATLLVVV